MRSRRRSGPAAGPRPRRRRRGDRPGRRVSARACSSAVIVRCRAKTRPWRQASSPVSSATAVTWRLVDAHLDAPADQPRGRASSRWCRRADTDRARRASTQRRAVSGIAVGSGHQPCSSAQPVDRPRLERLVRARVDLRKPGVELVLEVELVGEHAGRARSWSPRSPAAARPRPWPADRPARRTATRPSAARRRRRTPPSGGRRGRGCRPGDPRPALAADAPEPLQAAGDPGQQILGLRGEHQHAGAGARVAQARDDDPAAAGLAVPDRHLRRGCQTSNWQTSPGR